MIRVRVMIRVRGMIASSQDQHRIIESYFIIETLNPTPNPKAPGPDSRRAPVSL